MPLKKPKLKAPFDNIALAFSGGGFRAGAYALGVMSYLNTLNVSEKETVLEKVTFLSSASGGTIATATYALFSAQGKRFGDWYKHLFENFEADRLVVRVFEILNDDKVWEIHRHKTRNIINAFAIAYHELLFDGKHVSDLKTAAASHLEEVCFNATEFYTGLLFRQSVKMKTDVKDDKEFRFGNFSVSLGREAAEQLRLADLLAASSCFPAGFEPIIFPGDFGDPEKILPKLSINCRELSLDEAKFLYGEDTLKEITSTHPDATMQQLLDILAKKPLRKDFKIGLMDGGITDNQGVESVIKANDRRRKKQSGFKRFGLMLINDVGSHFMDPYELPSAQKLNPKHPWLTINTIYGIATLLLLLGGAGIASGFFIPDVLWSKIIAVIGTVLLLTGGLPFVVLRWAKKQITGKVDGKGLALGKNFSPEVISQLLGYFSSTPVETLLVMLKQRFNSVLTLNNDVFLKRVRQLLYKQFFENENNVLRVKANHIYDFSFTNDVNAQNQEYKRVTPNREIQLVAEHAYNMATTLWFDPQNVKSKTQAAIIATGQFTTCFNLLQYVERLREHDIYQDKQIDANFLGRIDTLTAQLRAEAEMFQENPFWLYNKLGVDFQIGNFEKCSVGELNFPDGFEGLRR